MSNQIVSRSLKFNMFTNTDIASCHGLGNGRYTLYPGFASSPCLDACHNAPFMSGRLSSRTIHVWTPVITHHSCLDACHNAPFMSGRSSSRTIHVWTLVITHHSCLNPGGGGTYIYVQHRYVPRQRPPFLT